MANLASLLGRALPEEALALLRQIGALANAGSADATAAYLIGGSVRDILLDRPPLNLDITVAGDGPTFARALAGAVGGEATGASEFGTAKVLHGAMLIDIAMARSETYSAPGALPEVKPAGIDEDLARRDFSMNALAIDLSPNRWGELIDHHSGLRDVSTRRIRVLHDNSFQDDPTRAMRALRFEARYGFIVEPHTLELLVRDAGYLERVSASRVRAELARVLAEPSRHLILASAEARGVLAGMHPALRVPPQVIEAMERASAAENGHGLLVFLSMMVSALTEGEIAALKHRLDPPKEWVETMDATLRYRHIALLLERPDLARSEIVDVLEPFPAHVLQAHRELTRRDVQRERIDLYLSTLRHVRHECTGEDLMAAGVPQGPMVGDLLAELKRARLNESVRSKVEELALVRRRLPLMKEFRRG